ncbi:hypothetical protein CLOSTHATH_05741 [Hungatella hathewayi DSM 13479]|uniref:Uncharacterized protein n=1 Tax=Hungatella hathewayi DSM 13479 TaxID=566550 RepID=D3AQ35_9FIRM|nr:hypothetical protein CLOSTHATH_05741 [Hungatella hathewayi DSM 13479]
MSLLCFFLNHTALTYIDSCFSKKLHLKKEKQAASIIYDFPL